MSTASDASAPLLEVRNLQTHFHGRSRSGGVAKGR